MTTGLLSKLRKRLLSADVLAPENVVQRAQWLEVALLPLVVIAATWLLSPQDPMLSKAQFPWFWFVPLLISLRYGVLTGLLGSLPIMVSWVVASRLGLVEENFSLKFFFGAGLLILVCGEFSDVWRDRTLRMSESYLYMAERLSRLTRRHLLLNLSHDRLEQEMLARPGSLRDALVRLRAIVIETSGSTSPMPGSAGLLHLLEQYVNVESAALYLLQPKGLDMVLGERVDLVGEPAALRADDDLLRLAIETHSLAHIANRDVALERQSSQLVVAPLIAGNDTLIGVLAVTRMPFFSLNVENLQMMSVILAYFADTIRSATDVREVQAVLPTMPALFAEELTRMILMQKKVAIYSHIVVMSFNGPLGEEIPTEFIRIKRGLDLYWQTQVRGKPVVAVLLPFASQSAKDGFMHRVEGWLQTRFQGNFEKLEIYVRTIDFAVEDPIRALVETLRE
jgi:hypothetical protein